MVVDRPVQIGEWEPENYGGRYRGPVTLRTAFANSINTVAVQMAETVGIHAVIATAKGLGIQSELPAVPSLALGSAERDVAGNDPSLCGDRVQCGNSSKRSAFVQSRAATRICTRGPQTSLRAAAESQRCAPR